MSFDINKKETSKRVMLPVIMISMALALRQMSMTIVSPFISTYCKELTGYTPLLAGLAIGAFGLMQAIFQIPFGVLSDRFGNKKIMVIGLAMVVIGFVAAYYAHDIWLLIFARSLQGSGAVIGVGYSWAASLAGHEHQSNAMSVLGAFVSASAALAFALGPLLRDVMDVEQMFLMGAVLLTFNTLYILFFLPDKRNGTENKVPLKKTVKVLLQDKTFTEMNLVAFCNNFMMMAVFYAAPIYMDEVVGQKGMWKIFVPAIVIAIVFMKCMVKKVSKGRLRAILTLTFIMSADSILFYFGSDFFICLLTGTVLYLCGYITIATLTATQVNKLLDEELRGTGNGVFNSFQYIGSFAGAIVMGLVWGVSQIAAWMIVIVAGVIGIIITRNVIE